MINVFLSICKKGLVIPAFFYVGVLSSCDRDVKKADLNTLSLSGPTMGTRYNVKLVSESTDYSQAEIKKWIDDELLRINQSMSTYIADSELSRFNQLNPDTVFAVSKDLCHLIQVNNEISVASAGRYDVTVGPLVNLWGFGPEGRQDIPSQAQITEAKQKVGYEALSFDCEENRLIKSKPVYVDLSASAKGYAADLVASLLQNKGFSHAMVEIGGELRVLGQNASGGAWKIAVEKPTLGRSGGMQVLALTEVGVATSGDYRNYYEIDGKRISHTIDPLTSAPITHSLASVTVIMGSAALADAWATAFNVLGPEEGFRIAVEQNIAAYFISREQDDFSVKYTPAFEQYMVNL